MGDEGVEDLEDRPDASRDRVGPFGGWSCCSHVFGIADTREQIKTILTKFLAKAALEKAGYEQPHNAGGDFRG